MKRPGGTVLARRWAVWAAMMLVAASARATSPDTSHLMPANYSPTRAADTATGSAAATPPPPSTGQVGLYENEPIHRAPVAGSAASGGAAPANPTPWSLSRVPAALAVVLVLIVGLKWLMGKMSGGPGRKRSTRVMQVLARSTVSPRQQLMLIQIGKRLVLVGNSGGAMSPLCQIDDPTEVASLIGQVRAERSSTPVSSFKSLFGRANDDYEPPPPGMFKERSREEEEPQERSIAAEMLDRRESRDEVMLSPDQRPSDEEITKPVADDPAVLATGGELSELMAKVRRMSQGFQRK